MTQTSSHRRPNPDLDAQLAHVLVRRTAELIRVGREPGAVGRLAVIYSRRVYPTVPQEPAPVRKPEQDRHHFASVLRGGLPYPVIGAIGEAIK